MQTQCSECKILQVTNKFTIIMRWSCVVMTISITQPFLNGPGCPDATATLVWPLSTCLLLHVQQTRTSSEL